MPAFTCGGVVLCGGKSSRMGRPKAWLPMGNELMLQRIVRILAQVVKPIVVSAAENQDLPELPEDVIVVRDTTAELGPLQGIAIGLSALQETTDAAYITSCDVPLLSIEFIQYMIGLLQENDIVVPRDKRFHHPLAAVYRTSLAQMATDLIQADRLRPVFLFEKSKTLEVPIEQFQVIDPELKSLLNINLPEQYEAVLRIIENEMD